MAHFALFNAQSRSFKHSNIEGSMKFRTRSRKRTAAMGKTIYPTTGDLGPYSYTEADNKIEDYIEKKKREDGSTPPSDLNLLTRKVVPPGLTHYQKFKANPTTPPQRLGYNLPCTQPGATGPFLSPPGGWSTLEPSDSDIIFRGLSSSNPFRYEVSVPVMVAELIEASTLFSVQLASLGTAIGSSYLNVKFGWESLLRDIKTFVGLLGAIESRLREFNSLIKKGGVRRRVSISSKSTSVVVTNSACYSNSYSTWYCDANITYSSKVWLSVRWRPRRNKAVEVERLIASKQELLKILLGFERNRLITTWEIIPFSWLIDYFIDVSSTLQSIENSDLVEPYDICIMRDRRCTVRTQVRPKSRDDSFYGYSYATPGRVEQRQRLRKVALLDVSAFVGLLKFGILTASQAQTILALLYSRKR